MQAEVFDRYSVVPALVGRQRQTDALLRCVGAAQGGLRPINACLIGPSGCGKRAVAWLVAEKLRQRAAARVCFLDCGLSNSAHQLLDLILKELGQTSSNIGLVWKVGQIESALRGRCLIVVLDDFNAIRPQERRRCIAALTAIRRTGLIVICHRAQAPSALDGRLLTKLSPRVIRFEPYTPDEIEAILAEISRQGLRPGAITKEALHVLARGCRLNVGEGIQMIRIAALAAEVAGVERITEELSRQVCAEHLGDMAALTVRDLPGWMGWLHGYVSSNGPASSTTVHRELERALRGRGRNAPSHRTVQRGLVKLRDLGLVGSHQQPGMGNLRRYGPAGPETES